MEQMRHGDVFLQRIDAIPEGVVLQNHRVLMEGEATGHAHRASEGLLYEKNGELYFSAPEGGAKLNHEEHHTIVIPEGNWAVTRQVEYLPDAPPQNVLD
jgi:uncharacterized protein involved in high-affinity Fe2+ transport